MQAVQRLDDNEHTYVGRDFPPPTPAHLSARLVPTQLQPLLLLSVSSGIQHPACNSLCRAWIGEVLPKTKSFVCCSQLCGHRSVLSPSNRGRLTEAITRQHRKLCSLCRPALRLAEGHSVHTAEWAGAARHAAGRGQRVHRGRLQPAVPAGAAARRCSSGQQQHHGVAHS